MNDLDNDDTDNLSDQANLTHKKTKRFGHNNDIYERFLNRVQNIDSGNNKDKEISPSKHVEQTEQLSAYDSLSLEESPIIPAPEPQVAVIVDKDDEMAADDVDNTVKATVFNTTDRVGESISTFSDESYNNQSKNHVSELSSNTNNSDTNTNTNKQWSKRSSGINLLIISVICGLLISAVIVFVLNANDKLTDLNSSAQESATTIDSELVNSEPASTNVPVTINNETDNNENDNPPLPTVNTETTLAPTTTKLEPTIDAKTVENVVANSADKNSEQPAPKKAGTSKTSEKREIAASNDTETKSNISIDDFKEEAQSTLYREIND